LKVESQVSRQPHALGGHVEIVRQRMTNDLRLLVNLLRHEVTVVALVDKEGGGRGFDHATFDLAAFGVAHLDTGAGEHDRVAILEIGD
jgi:hypothetical protein